MNKAMNRKEIISASLIAVVMTVLDFSGYPAAWFIHIEIADVNPIYFVLLINQWLVIFAGILAVHYFCKNLTLGLERQGFREGIKRYFVSGICMILLTALFFFAGMTGHFDYQPSFLKVLIEGFVYYLSVGIIEELYIRGLLLNIIERLCCHSKNAAVTAIILSSLIFSLGHIPGMIGQDLFTILFRMIWTQMLGIYLGVVYKATKNLWTVILLHILIDFGGVSFCFTAHPFYNKVTVVLTAALYLVIGTWSLLDFIKTDEKKHSDTA